jgi:hypothetical protein
MSRTSGEASERVKRLRQGNAVMAEKWKIKPSTMTAMYLCTIGDVDMDGHTHIEGSMNVCSICLCLEDEPYNYGEEIEPTAYDGDCDECHGESLPYAKMDCLFGFSGGE